MTETKADLIEIHGVCDERFAGVREAFAANFAAGLECGASVAVTVDGEPMVDLWAGDADETGTPWVADTIVNVYSTTKTMAGLCMLMLADRGELDFDAPVAQYWPEFAQNGKESVLVSHVMAHTSGVAGWDTPLAVEDLYDWEKVTGMLAAQPPWWEPGTQSGYHAITQGYLQGEILRRITGDTMDAFFRSQVAGPLGADFHICLDAAHDERVADLVPPGSASASLAAADPSSLMFRALSNPVVNFLEPRTREWRAAEIPAAGGLGNARSVSRVHSAMACGGTVDGVTLLSPEGVEAVLQEQHVGMDDVLGAEMRFGMGFGLGNETMPLPPRTFFWGGAGGSLALIDLDTRSTVSYVMNRMEPDLIGDPRGAGIALAAMTALMGG